MALKKKEDQTTEHNRAQKLRRDCTESCLLPSSATHSARNSSARSPEFDRLPYTHNH